MFIELHSISCIRMLCLQNWTAFLVTEGDVYRFTQDFLYRNLPQSDVVSDDPVRCAAGDVPSARLLQTTRSLDQGQSFVKCQGHLSDMLLVMAHPHDSYKQQTPQGHWTKVKATTTTTAKKPRDSKAKNEIKTENYEVSASTFDYM